MQTWRRWQDWTNATIALWLLFAPFVLGTSDTGVVVGSEITMGVLIGSTALYALSKPASQGAQWTNALFGAALFFAPWMFGYSGVAGAAWNDWILGATVATLALSALPSAGRAGKTVSTKSRTHEPTTR